METPFPVYFQWIQDFRLALSVEQFSCVQTDLNKIQKSFSHKNFYSVPCIVFSGTIRKLPRSTGRFVAPGWCTPTQLSPCLHTHQYIDKSCLQRSRRFEFHESFKCTSVRWPKKCFLSTLDGLRVHESSFIFVIAFRQMFIIEILRFLPSYLLFVFFQSILYFYNLTRYPSWRTTTVFSIIFIYFWSLRVTLHEICFFLALLDQVRCYPLLFFRLLVDLFTLDFSYFSSGNFEQNLFRGYSVVWCFYFFKKAFFFSFHNYFFTSFS